jgi:hypothetical protein
MGNTGALDPLLEEPLHGMTAFEVHRGRHDSFNFTTQILGGESAICVFCD